MTRDLTLELLEIMDLRGDRDRGARALYSISADIAESERVFTVFALRYADMLYACRMRFIGNKVFFYSCGAVHACATDLRICAGTALKFYAFYSVADF